MDIITLVYLTDDHKIDRKVKFAMSEWYAKPAILYSLANFFHDKDEHLSFIYSEKYNCSQFHPYDSPRFHVHHVFSYRYKNGLNWIVPEFK